MMLLSCPRISPQWQLAAQLALVKPKPYTRDKIAHTSARQRWPRNGRRVIHEFARDRSLQAEFHLKSADFLHIQLEPTRGKRIARQLSRLLPSLWFNLDGQFLRDGVFYTCTGRYKLELVRASRVRLRRSVHYGFLGDVDHAITSAHQRARHNRAAQ
jgi:hypothetical protein